MSGPSQAESARRCVRKASRRALESIAVCPRDLMNALTRNPELIAYLAIASSHRDEADDFAIACPLRRRSGLAF